YGAGYFIEELMKIIDKDQLELTDSANSAALFYNAFSNQAESILYQSKVGQMLLKAGFDKDIEFTCKKNTVDLVPKLKEQRIIVRVMLKYSKSLKEQEETVMRNTVHFDHWLPRVPKTLTVPETTLFDNLLMTVQKYPDKV